MRRACPYRGENPGPGKDALESLTTGPELENSQGLGRVKTLYRKSLGRAGLNASWFSGFDYARIAAINGWMPMMFITRVRL